MDSLQQLQQQLQACRLCLEAGYEIVPPAVFSGHERAQVMIIGQAPGVTEAETGRPMNAGSGRRLFEWLGLAGWDEAEFRACHYLTAVTKCYPGRHHSGKGDRVPTKEEQALCRPYLEREIALVNPRLIIPVGTLAIKRFYPASIRLNEVIGTAAYFPPEALHNPVNFNIKQAQRLNYFDRNKPPEGRWVVPLPHPSGVSTWPNLPKNKKLIERATSILNELRQAWHL